MAVVSASSITYNDSSNRITVIGYSLGTPCNFNNIWTADKAGTFTLFSASIYDGNTTNLTTQVRPTDELSLKIDFIISNLVGSGNLIVRGTNKDSSYQEENLSITANTSYQTTEWYKTITNFTIDGFNSTLEINQSQWGMVWKQGTYQFLLNCQLWLGDGITATYFADEQKYIVFDGLDVAQVQASRFVVRSQYSNCHFRLGRCTNQATKKTDRGCDIKIVQSFGCISTIGGYNVELYRSIVTGIVNCGVYRGGGTWLMYNSHINYLVPHTTGTYYNLLLDRLESPKGTMTKIIMWAATIYHWSDSTVNCYDFVNIGTSLILRVHTLNEHWKHVDCDYVWDNVNIAIWGGLSQTTGTIDRAYTFNIKTIDKDNVEIENANVTLRNKDEELFSLLTDASGEITEQIVTSNYWKQEVKVPIVDVWNETNLNPFTLTITHQSYLTKEFTFNLTKKTDWIIALGDEPFIVNGTLIIDSTKDTIVVKQCAFIPFIFIGSLGLILGLLRGKYKIVKK